MSTENPHTSPQEATHIRSREEVEVMNDDAERIARILKMAERLGGTSVEQVVQPVQPESPRDTLD